MKLVLSVCRDHEREVAGPRIEIRAVHGDDVQPELGADCHDRARDRRLAHDEDARRGHDRLEEDLDRAVGQARVLDGHGPVLGRRVGVRGAALARFRERKDPQQHGLAALDRLQRVCADAVLRARTTHEPLDRPVAEHERDAADLGARRALRPHDGRCRESDALGGELLRPA